MNTLHSGYEQPAFDFPSEVEADDPLKYIPHQSTGPHDVLEDEQAVVALDAPARPVYEPPDNAQESLGGRGPSVEELPDDTILAMHAAGLRGRAVMARMKSITAANKRATDHVKDEWGGVSGDSNRSDEQDTRILAGRLRGDRQLAPSALMRALRDAGGDPHTAAILMQKRNDELEARRARLKNRSSGSQAS